MTLPFDPLQQIYPSERCPLFASRGMVNCSVPQASAAGLAILQKGGNAMDAAVAAAAALTVTEPTANGIGGDAFALIWSEKDKKLYGLNSSGRSPQLASAARVLADGRDEGGSLKHLYNRSGHSKAGHPESWPKARERSKKEKPEENPLPR